MGPIERNKLNVTNHIKGFRVLTRLQWIRMEFYQISMVKVNSNLRIKSKMLLVMNALLICTVLQINNKLLFMGDKIPHKIQDHYHQV